MNFDKLPSGLTIQMTLSDADTQAYAEKYLAEHYSEIKDLVHKKAGISLDISDPVIRFRDDEIHLSARAGMRFMKVTASAAVSVLWDGDRALVNVKSLEGPVIAIDPQKANALIRDPVQNFVRELQQDFDIRSFRITDGSISIKAIKK